MEAVAQFLPIVVIGAVMYFVLILPQQRRTKEHRSLLASLEEGDEVVTNGGVYGFVAAVDDDVIWLEVSDGVELKLSKAAVANKVVLKDQPQDDADEDS
jgi:preprotein translocase subunit YajC